MDKEMEILIEGDMVSLIRREKVKTIGLSEFSRRMASSGWFSGLLPSGCRLAGRSNNGMSRYYCIERPPVITSVSTERGGPYRVSLGFVQFWLGFPDRGSVFPNSKFVSTTKEPIKGDDTMLGSFPWPNVYSSGAICTGSVTIEGGNHREVCEDFVRAFFGATFNRDLNVTFPESLGGGTSIAGGMREWAKQTKVNPLFGISRQVEYIPLRTVGEMVNKLSGGDPL